MVPGDEFGLIDQHEALCRAIIDSPTGIGDEDAAGCAPKKFDSQAVFEILDFAADGCWRNSELAGRGHEASPFDNANECNQIIELLHFLSLKILAVSSVADFRVMRVEALRSLLA
jgi:hypothetical protein